MSLKLATKKKCNSYTIYDLNNLKIGNKLVANFQYNIEPQE